MPARVRQWRYSHLCLSLLPDSGPIPFLFNLAASTSMSPFRHGIATVHQSCHHCFLPEIYIIFARAPASMTTYKVTEHWGRPFPTPSYQWTGMGGIFSHPWQHIDSQIQRLILVARFKKKKRKEKPISTTPKKDVDGWIAKVHSLHSWLCHCEVCILDLHICWLLISNCQQLSMHMLKYKKTLIGCSPVVIVWLQYDQGEVQCQQELLWCVSPDPTSQDMTNTTNKAQLMMSAALLMQIDNYARNISLTWWIIHPSSSKIKMCSPASPAPNLSNFWH